MENMDTETKINRLIEYFEDLEQVKNDLSEICEGNMLNKLYHFNTHTGKITDSTIPGVTLLGLDFRNSSEILSEESISLKFEDAIADYISSSYNKNDDFINKNLLLGNIDFETADYYHLMLLITKFDQATLNQEELNLYLKSLKDSNKLNNTFDKCNVTQIFPMEPISFYEVDENIIQVINNIQVYAYMNDMKVCDVFDYVDEIINDQQFIDGVSDNELVNHRKKINDLVREKINKK